MAYANIASQLQPLSLRTSPKQTFLKTSNKQHAISSSVIRSNNYLSSTSISEVFNKKDSFSPSKSELKIYNYAFAAPILLGFISNFLPSRFKEPLQLGAVATYAILDDVKTARNNWNERSIYLDAENQSFVLNIRDIFKYGDFNKDNFFRLIPKFLVNAAMGFAFARAGELSAPAIKSIPRRLKDVFYDRKIKLHYNNHVLKHYGIDLKELADRFDDVVKQANSKGNPLSGAAIDITPYKNRAGSILQSTFRKDHGKIYIEMIGYRTSPGSRLEFFDSLNHSNAFVTFSVPRNYSNYIRKGQFQIIDPKLNCPHLEQVLSFLNIPRLPT